jgi:hypothetical protein
MSFERLFIARRLERLAVGLATLQGEVLAAIGEAQPPVKFDGEAVSPLVGDLLDLNRDCTGWRQRIKERLASLNAAARLERSTRRPR